MPQAAARAPIMKRSADELEPPASTSAADAAQGVEDGTKHGQDGPSNRSGGVLPPNKRVCEGDHAVEWDETPKQHRRRGAMSSKKKLRGDRATARHKHVECVSCRRKWQTTACRKNLVCQWCEKGPLCKDCRLGPNAHPPSCNACVDALPASCMVDVFQVGGKRAREVAAKWAYFSNRVVSAAAAIHE